MTSRRRIVLVLPGSETGGSERQAILTAIALREYDGWEPAIAASGRGPLFAHAQDADIRTIHLPALDGRPPFVWLRRLNAIRKLTAFQPQVVIPFTWSANVFCIAHRRQIGANLTFWNQRDVGLLRGNKKREKIAIDSCQHFLANSPASRAHLHALGVTNECIHLIPNFVHITPAKTPLGYWQSKLGLEDGQAMVVMVANFTQAKAHLIAVQAWKHVLENHSTSRRPVLVFAGRADATFTNVQATIRSLGLQESIRCIGPIDDVTGLFSDADLCLHASRSEGCPNVVLEAMATGCPVVASDLPGCRYALDNCGLLPADGDPKAHAEAIIRMLSSTQLRSEFRAQALLRIRNVFSDSVVIDAYRRALSPS